MERAQVLVVMRDLAVRLLELDGDAVVETASFVTDLGIDSLDLVEYVMALEDELAIELPEEELTDLTDIGGLVTVVTAKVAAKVLLEDEQAAGAAAVQADEQGSRA